MGDVTRVLEARQAQRARHGDDSDEEVGLEDFEVTGAVETAAGVLEDFEVTGAVPVCWRCRCVWRALMRRVCAVARSARGSRSIGPAGCATG